MRIFLLKKKKSKSDCMEISPHSCLLRITQYLASKTLYSVKRNGWNLVLRILVFQIMNHNL